jgi:hypothetical protein
MDELDEKKREWDAIHAKEQARRRNMEELRKLVEQMGDGRKTAKSLLKLAVYTDGIKVSDAADIIGVKREVVSAWAKMLMEKEYVDIESTSHPNPTIRPTKQILSKFIAYQRRREKRGPLKVEDDMKGLEEAVKEPSATAEASDGSKPGETPGDEEVELDSGSTYLVFESKSEQSLRLFSRETRKGVKGLFITRSNPTQVKKKHFLGDAKVVWLTSVQTGNDVESIAGLQELSILVSNFIDENEKSIILLEGIEYLISNNNFPVVLRLIQQLRDKVSTSDSMMIMPVNPEALEDKQMPLLESECQTIK